MTDALRRRGHWTSKSGIAPNIGCTRELADALERRLELAVERNGHKVAIVGWSRGGTLGKIVSARRPELVAALITLGTPNTDPLAVNATLAAQLSILTRLHALGFPGVLGDDCISGDCAREVRGWLDADFPPGIPYTSVFSLDDGVIDWRACLDPAARAPRGLRHAHVDGSRARGHRRRGRDPGSPCPRGDLGARAHTEAKGTRAPAVGAPQCGEARRGDG